jgi:hypothetical protein
LKLESLVKKGGHRSWTIVATETNSTMLSTRHLQVTHASISNYIPYGIPGQGRGRLESAVRNAGLKSEPCQFEVYSGIKRLPRPFLTRIPTKVWVTRWRKPYKWKYYFLRLGICGRAWCEVGVISEVKLRQLGAPRRWKWYGYG